MKKTIAKLAVSLLLALTVLTPLAGSSKVLAASKKQVSISVTQRFIGSSFSIYWQVENYKSNHPTYNYDDGEYSGTLHLSYAIKVNSITLGYDFYEDSYMFVYAGEVTKEEIPITKKYVTVEVYKSFTGTVTEINNQVSDYIANNYYYYYNKDSFKGNLTYSGVQLLSTTPYGSLYIYSVITAFLCPKSTDIFCPQITGIAAG